MGKKRRISTPSRSANEKAEKEPQPKSSSKQQQQQLNQIEESYLDRTEPEVTIEEGNEEKDEVGEARFRFYGALKGLTDKAKNHEDSTSESSLFDEEEEGEDEDMFSDSQINIVRDRMKVHEFARKYHESKDSPLYNFNNALTNKYIHSAHHLAETGDDAKFPDETSGGVVTKQSYVMKLFDRSVDLAQFDDSTPLYPICRSWVANQPKKPWEKKKEIPPVPTWKIKSEEEEDDAAAAEKEMEKENEVTPAEKEGESSEKPATTEPVSDADEIKPEQVELKVIAKLPPPTYYVDVNATSIRIPIPLPKYLHELNAMLPDETKTLDELPTKEDLMSGHLDRWSSIKRSWLHASQKNEERYKKSRKLLLMMYNRSQKEFSQ